MWPITFFGICFLFGIFIEYPILIITKKVSEGEKRIIKKKDD
jgi:hypothetical protein